MWQQVPGEAGEAAAGGVCVGVGVCQWKLGRSANKADGETPGGIDGKKN